MPNSTEENNVIECLAKFEGLKELLEEDISEEQPSAAEFKNVTSNHPAFKELYLQLRVVQKKYKARYVPNTVTETLFNAPESQYKYNDNWLNEIKSDFKRVNKNVVIFLDSQTSVCESDKEQKFNETSQTEVTMLLKKLSLEKSQVTSSIDETYKHLQSLTSINANQGLVYSNLQH